MWNHYVQHIFLRKYLIFTERSPLNAWKFDIHIYNIQAIVDVLCDFKIVELCGFKVTFLCAYYRFS